MRHRSLFNKKIALTLCSFVFAIGVVLGIDTINTSRQAAALSANDFNAGRIIDDAVFYNKDAMSAQQIQDFLNKLIPTCDTWGTGQSEYGGGTRAQYAASVGWSAPPYVCLNNYYENPNNGETSYEKGGGSFDGGVSAAQIIYNASQQYGINPQVLLVLLKKESAGPLTAEKWPLKSQYKYAMGYGCPDSGPGYSANCNDTQAGFYKQMTKAAWQLKYYKDHANDYRYKVGQNKIQYAPDPTCGEKDVYIENIATLSLYIYTPYTPNSGSLNNYPGTASCGAYGNRNFFMFYSEWFGSTYFNGVQEEKGAVWRLYNPKTGGHILSSSYEEVNTYLIHNWINDGVVTRTSDSGTISVHRLYNPRTGFHNIATDSEITNLKNQGWIDDGEVLKGFSSGTPVWRMSKDGHFFTTNNPTEVTTYLQNRWNLDGILYYELSEYEKPLWRLFNPATNQHIFISNIPDITNYLRAGWTSDGVVFSGSASDNVPVYRLWNGRSHFMTASEAEKNTYVAGGWKNDGVVFNGTSDTTATPVYRLWNGSSHFMTASESEKNTYVSAGWKNDGIVFYVNNSVLAHRMFNSSTGAHRVSTSPSEIYSNIKQGWQDDGVLFKVSKTTGTPVYELTSSATGSYFYTTSTQEVSAYTAAGWKSNGVKYYTPTNGVDTTRLYSPMSKTHILVQSPAEKQTYINAGWVNDGIVFKTYN